MQKTALVVTVSLMLAFASCDKTRPIPNAVPAVAGVDGIACVERVCDVVLRLFDADAEPVDLAVECMIVTGGTCTLTDEPGTDGRSGLVPDREAPGRTHLLRLKIEGVGVDADVKLRLTPTDARELVGEAYTTPAFTLAAGL